MKLFFVFILIWGSLIACSSSSERDILRDSSDNSFCRNDLDCPKPQVCRNSLCVDAFLEDIEVIDNPEDNLTTDVLDEDSTRTTDSIADVYIDIGLNDVSNDVGANSDITDLYDIIEDIKDIKLEDVSDEKYEDIEDVYPEDTLSDFGKDIEFEDSGDINDVRADIIADDVNNCSCIGKICGDDNGCGEKCTNCPSTMICNQITWTCESCVPKCDGKECGSDGCGGACPPGCKSGQQCVNGFCKGCIIEPYGQDFNLTRRCVKAVCDSNSPYYFEDISECSSNKSWLIAVESEASLGASCPGPVNCSFKINGKESPVQINWYQHQSECGPNWTINMKVDHNTFPSPCEGDYWTWFAFMDHVQTNGGPYPPVLETTTHHALSFACFTPMQNSSARVFIGGQWWWGGKARAIEFNLFLQQWGDADPHPGLIVKFDTAEFEFLALDASYWELNITPNSNVIVEIPWGRILQDAVNNGWLVAPSSWSNVNTMAYFIGLEVKNRAVGDLWHTDFRILKKP